MTQLYTVGGTPQRLASAASAAGPLRSATSTTSGPRACAPSASAAGPCGALRCALWLPLGAARSGRSTFTQWVHNRGRNVVAASAHAALRAQKMNSVATSSWVGAPHLHGAPPRQQLVQQLDLLGAQACARARTCTRTPTCLYAALHATIVVARVCTCGHNTCTPVHAPQAVQRVPAP